MSNEVKNSYNNENNLIHNNNPFNHRSFKKQKIELISNESSQQNNGNGRGRGRPRRTIDPIQQQHQTEAINNKTDDDDNTSLNNSTNPIRRSLNSSSLKSSRSCSRSPTPPPPTISSVMKLTKLSSATTTKKLNIKNDNNIRTSTPSKFKIKIENDQELEEDDELNHKLTNQEEEEEDEGDHHSRQIIINNTTFNDEEEDSYKLIVKNENQDEENVEGEEEEEEEKVLNDIKIQINQDYDDDTTEELGEIKRTKHYLNDDIDIEEEGEGEGEGEGEDEDAIESDTLLNTTSTTTTSVASATTNKQNPAFKKYFSNNKTPNSNNINKKGLSNNTVYDFTMQALEMSLYGYLRQTDPSFVGHSISGLRLPPPPLPQTTSQVNTSQENSQSTVATNAFIASMQQKIVQLAGIGQMESIINNETLSKKGKFIFIFI
jgi:hypothetical protein